MSPPNHQPQPQPNYESEPEPEPQHQNPQLAEEKKSNTLAIAILIVRIITLICLVLSLIIILSNTATFLGPYGVVVTVRFNNLNTYRYMVSAIVIGLAHTSSQIASGIKHVSTGKRLVKHDAMPIIDFFGSQVILCLLATAVGAAFAATVESKKTLDSWDDMLESKGDLTLSQSRPKLDTFFNMANVSASFLFIAFLTCAVSSTLSALSLSNKH